ncbi:MAG: proton-conducting transporter membrane subunit, partial [Pannonibacter indicus]
YEGAPAPVAAFLATASKVAVFAVMVRLFQISPAASSGVLSDVLTIIAETLPHLLYDTAYALAVEVAASDIAVSKEELRILQLLRDRFRLDKLTCAAIERGAIARYRLA